MAADVWLPFRRSGIGPYHIRQFGRSRVEQIRRRAEVGQLVFPLEGVTLEQRRRRGKHAKVRERRGGEACRFILRKYTPNMWLSSIPTNRRGIQWWTPRVFKVLPVP